MPGPVRTIAAAREPALALTTTPDGHVAGVSPGVRRVWSLPELRVVSETRPDDDPAADLPGPVLLTDITEGELPATAVLAPGGAVAAVPGHRIGPRVVACDRAHRRPLGLPADPLGALRDVGAGRQDPRRGRGLGPAGARAPRRRGLIRRPAPPRYGWRRRGR